MADKGRADALMLPLRIHHQPEDGLMRGLLTVQSGIVVELVPAGIEIGHAAVDMAHDGAVILGHEKTVGKDGKTGGKAFRRGGFGRGKTARLQSGDGGQVFGAGLSDMHGSSWTGPAGADLEIDNGPSRDGMTARRMSGRPREKVFQGGQQEHLCPRMCAGRGNNVSFPPSVTDGPRRCPPVPGDLRTPPEERTGVASRKGGTRYAAFSVNRFLRAASDRISLR